MVALFYLMLMSGFLLMLGIAGAVVDYIVLPKKKRRSDLYGKRKCMRYRAV